MADLKMLAIDLGASSGRGIVGKFDGNKISLEEIHRFDNNVVNLWGNLYWDTLALFTEIKNAIRSCALSDNKDIKSIAIDTWGVDYGLLDKNGRLMGNPYCYRDPRTTTGIMDEVFNKLGKKELYSRTGTQFMNFNTLFQLAKEAQDSPYVFENAQDMLFVPDLLKYFLTGVKQTEYTIASTAQMLDAKERNWAYDIIEKLGIPTRILGDIVQPGTKCGKLLPAILDEVGNIDADVVAAASHDTASAVISVPAKNDDFVYISSGTWSLMGREIPEPITNDKAYDYNITNEGGAERKIRFLKNIMGLWIEQESRRQWKREGKAFSFDELSNAAMASKPCQCIINPDDPAFGVPGNLPKAIREYCKKTGQHVPENEGEIVRAIFDSLALRYKWSVEAIDDMKGKRIPFINIVGGGTKEAPLCQLCADACERPVYAGPVEATAIGNIAVQAISSGEIKDLSEAREVVRNSFEIDHYEPKGDKAMWDDAYAKFLKLIEA